MLPILIAVAMIGAEPKAISGSDYYAQTIIRLDRCKTDKDIIRTVARINKDWSKKRIIVKFQIEKTINNIAYLHSLEKDGDWRTYAFQSWLPQRGQPGDTITISGVPVIGETKPENEIGILHGGGLSIKYRVDRPVLKHQPAGR